MRLHTWWNRQMEHSHCDDGGGDIPDIDEKPTCCEALEVKILYSISTMPHNFQCLDLGSVLFI